MNLFKKLLTTPATPTPTREELDAIYGTREEQDAIYYAECSARSAAMMKKVEQLHILRRAKIASLKSQVATNELYAAKCTRPLVINQHLAAAARKMTLIAKLETTPV